MKYIVLIIGLLVVGCGEVENGAYKHRPKQATTAKPVKELTAQEKKVIGTYELELKKFGETQRYVLLDNSTVEYYLNGKKEEAEHKWSIVDKEVHIERENRAVSVFSINKDESITGIATIDEGGKRKEILKEHQYTRKKIKSSTHAPPPERSLEVQFLDGELNGTDLEEVTKLNLDGYQLTELPKNLKYLTQLKVLVLSKNQLTKLPEGLEKLTQLMSLNLKDNPDLTKAQIDELQKSLPKCKIISNPTK
jgi:Leucine-rich repeat (LRR) protein